MTRRERNTVWYHICSIALWISKQYSPNLTEFQDMGQITHPPAFLFAKSCDAPLLPWENVCYHSEHKGFLMLCESMCQRGQQGVERCE